MRAPKPPDVSQTAAAQSQANKEAVRESALVNQIGINSPGGRQFYTGEIGSPDRALNIELSPAGQEAYGQQEQLTSLLSGFGAEQLGPDVISRLMGGTSQQVGDDIFARSMGRIQPGFDRAEETLNSRLLGQGIPVGSRAYEQAQRSLGEQQAFQESDLALGADLQGLGEDRAQRSQAINELSALLQGAPSIGSPATSSPGQYGVTPPNIEGLTAQNYAGQQAAYGTQAQGLGSLLNLGGTLGGAGIRRYSDRRLKRNIRRIGTWINGLPVYAYNYLWNNAIQIGFMAHEVEKLHPQAVSEVGGFKMVDYGRAVA